MNAPHSYTSSIWTLLHLPALPHERALGIVYSAATCLQVNLWYLRSEFRGTLYAQADHRKGPGDVLRSSIFPHLLSLMFPTLLQ